MGILEGEDREKGSEELFETIMMRISPELMSDTKPGFQEVQSIPSSINTKEKRLWLIESFSLPPGVLVELIYNVVLVSGAQQSESVICLSIYLSIYPSSHDYQSA